MKIVLFQPQIPQNTGNIVRTCSAAAAGLILVRPLGFKTSNKFLKRAGLDYWDGVDVQEIDSLEEYLENLSTPFYFFSSKATKIYSTIDYSPEDHLIFGSETSGLPQPFHQRWKERFYRLPMHPRARCLNLSNSVAIVTYEALRQCNYIGMA